MGRPPTRGGSIDFNDMNALAINIQPVNHAGHHWSIADYPVYAPIHPIGDAEKWKLVDLRPLRGLIHAGAVTVSDEFREMVFGFDLLLLMGGTDAGEVTW